MRHLFLFSGLLQFALRPYFHLLSAAPRSGPIPRQFFGRWTGVKPTSFQLFGTADEDAIDRELWRNVLGRVDADRDSFLSHVITVGFADPKALT